MIVPIKVKLTTNKFQQIAKYIKRVVLEKMKFLKIYKVGGMTNFVKKIYSTKYHLKQKKYHIEQHERLKKNKNIFLNCEELKLLSIYLLFFPKIKLKIIFPLRKINSKIF